MKDENWVKRKYDIHDGVGTGQEQRREQATSI